MNNYRRFWLTGLLLALIVFNPADLSSCGPFFPEPIFTDQRVPPLPGYAKGQLGVLHSTFERRYLFVAYRYLSGKPLTGEEILSFVKPLNASLEVVSNPTSAIPATKEWLDARRRIPGLAPLSEYFQTYRGGSNRTTGEWRWFLNCTDDAFRTAARTLEARIKVLGIDNPGVKNWGMAQDMVFSNCSEGEHIPPAAEPDLPQPLKYDRAYQIAAAHFYAEQYETAANMFRAIAADSNSPWSTIAPYLVVRCLLRKATVPQKYGVFDRPALEEAQRELRSIRMNRNRASLHSIAGKLENYVDIRLNPQAHFLELSAKLLRPTTGNSFDQDLTDYLYLLNRVNRLQGLSLDAARKTSDMTDWIWTFASADEAHALERWKSTGGSIWLLAAMTGLRPGDPDAAAVMEAAQKLPKDSPAYQTAQYHCIRFLIESGKSTEARTLLDKLLPGFRKGMANSSLNLFLSQRLQLARNFDEFVVFAPRIPQENTGSLDPSLAEYGGPATSLFDRDATGVLNRGLPLRLLSRAARSNLPLHLRKQLVRAAWVRAVLIGDDPAAAELTGEILQIFPELKQDLETWLAARDDRARQFALTMLLMHFPGMSPYLQSGIPRRGEIGGIDNLRENWWCGFNADGDLETPTGSRYNFSRDQKQQNPPKPADFPNFLSESDRTRFMAEYKSLAAVPTAPDYFGKVVLAWAAKNPKDARVPEALHLVVRSTRFGCTDAESGNYSQKAFRLLHSRYSETEWSKSTPYWFR